MAAIAVSCTFTGSKGNAGPEGPEWLLVAFQAFMSTRKYKALGYVVPILFLALAGVNY